MNGLPPEVGELIGSTIDSVEAVEIIMLLRRSPQTYWSEQAVAEQLGMRPETARAKLQALHGRGIAAMGERTGAYRYAPKDERLKKALGELAAAYDDRRITVINAIYSANLERLRAFSDAFKVK